MRDLPAITRKAFWDHKRRDALHGEMADAKRAGNPLRYYAARDQLAAMPPARDIL